MDISIGALLRLIKKNEEQISNSKKQLRDLDEGKITLSNMKIASIENTLEESTNNLKKYQSLYNTISKQEKDNYKEQVRVQEALAKESYYKLQKIRLKRKKNISRNQKLEAMMIIDELTDDINIDDNELLELSQTVIKNNIREVVELENELIDIKNEFKYKLNLIEDNKDLKHFTMLDSYIPIVILHFSTLVANIKNSIIEKNEILFQKDNNKEKLLKFQGFPKFEDWWIEELFINHQAYFGLYKWKEIISNQCHTQQQKIIWEKLFNNWLMIKKILNSKEENAYEYNYIFDEMLKKYAGLEDELDINNLTSMEEIIFKITENEDFTNFKSNHNLVTTYSKWKSKKLNIN